MPATKRRAREENVLGDVTSKIQKSAPASSSGANGDAGAAGGLTVKGFLEQRRDAMIAEVDQRAAEQCALLRSQLAEGKDEYREELKAAKQAEEAAAAGSGARDAAPATPAKAAAPAAEAPPPSAEKDAMSAQLEAIGAAIKAAMAAGDRPKLKELMTERKKVRKAIKALP